MKTKIIALGAIVIGAVASPVVAQEGTVTGAAGGAVTGAIVGGPVGAAIGTLTANIVAWLWVLKRVAAVLESSVKHVFPWKEWSQQIAIGLLCVTTCVFIDALVDLTNVQSLVCKVPSGSRWIPGFPIRVLL